MKRNRTLLVLAAALASFGLGGSALACEADEAPDLAYYSYPTLEGEITEIEGTCEDGSTFRSHSCEDPSLVGWGCINLPCGSISSPVEYHCNTLWFRR
jgi:hypothetical protein